MDGFVVINKPAGITSFDVIRQARKKLNTRKIGHLGTLDPQATGVLVLAIGQATKLVEFLMRADKEYISTIRLGAESDTYDKDGEITQNNVDPVTLEQIENSLKKFKGTISQIPPKYSAVKIKGQRACDIMRKGGDVEIKSKKVTIHSIKIIDYKWPELKLKINCSSGTYVRSLANDLGKELKTGAYLSDLVRTLVGNFAVQGAVELENLGPADIRDVSEMVSDWPRWDMPEIVYGRLRAGLSVAAPPGLPQFKLIAAFCDGEFKGILEWIKGGTQLKFKKQIV